MTKAIPFVLSLVWCGVAAAAGDNPPSDAQIAHIAVTANQIDVDAGKLAIGKTQNAEVKKFAELMVKDHAAVNEQAGALAAKLGLTPEDNDTSKALKKGADATTAKLKGLSGAEFDRAYVANEVAYHRAVLEAVDKVLIPNAKNAELKKLLERARPVIAAHLAHAEGMQKTMR